MATSADNIAVLLATYNGEKYLAEQIESICNQSHSNFVLFVRDDDSQDQTRDLINEYTKRDSRIHLVKTFDGRLGVNGSFSYLTEYAKKGEFRYFSYSDQDDVWLKDKLSSQIRGIREIEKVNVNEPVLVHTDLEVVNESLESINKSFMKYQGINNETKEPLNVLLAQNYVTGCSILANRPLVEIAFPLPDEALMYDWWIALSGAVFGYIGYLEKPTVRYRQHTDNQIGAKSLYRTLNPVATNWIRQWKNSCMLAMKSKEQAMALERIIRERDYTNENIKIVMDYINLFSLPNYKKILSLSELGIHKQTFIRNILFKSYLLTSKYHK